MKLIIDIPEDIYDGLINNKGVVIVVDYRAGYFLVSKRDVIDKGTPVDNFHAQFVFNKLNRIGEWMVAA